MMAETPTPPPTTPTITATNLLAVEAIIDGATLIKDLITSNEYDVECKIKVENWTHHHLENPSAHVNWGYLNSPPVTIRTGHREMFKARKTGFIPLGTAGTASWKISGTNNMRVVVMWCCPYNFFLYNNVLAVGVTQSVNHNNAWYNEMFYSDVRKKKPWCSDLGNFYDDITPVEFKTVTPVTFDVGTAHNIKVVGTMGSGHKTIIDIQVMAI